ncbi:MAG: carboxypeptidase-like regulatory domain-containing protein [Gemmatimonadota bacterium]|nr:carboxypeptidase-like regulatory domain-containing protein [Gemmatimonadota bacterium]
MTKPHPATRPLSPLVATSLAVLSLSSATAARVAAQEPDCREDNTRIVGFVVDAGTESPLASVLVSVESPDRASLTTDNGRFLLCDIGPGERVLTASRLGYDTLRIRIGPNPSGEPLRLRLEPDPIILEGLEIVTDRFERRRRAGSGRVRTYDQEALAGSNYGSAADFVDFQAGVVTVACPIGNSVSHSTNRLMLRIDRMGVATTCVNDRGRIVSPRVYLDESPLLGGWTALESVPTSQLYMVEVCGRGTQIRAYTHRFMERAARTRLSLSPFWC